MKSEDNLSLAVGFLIGCTVTGAGIAILKRMELRKLNKKHAQFEKNFLQGLSDDLRDGNFPFDKETRAMFEKVLNPLRAKGLIKY